jgi:hypothetical protein
MSRMNAAVGFSRAVLGPLEPDVLLPPAAESVGGVRHGYAGHVL